MGLNENLYKDMTLKNKTDLAIFPKKSFEREFALSTLSQYGLLNHPDKYFCIFKKYNT